MKKEKINIEDLKNAGVDFLSITISKESVLNKDFSEPLNILNQLISNKSLMEYYRERVDILIDGYNNTSEELFEIPEVRNYVNELDDIFPFWLYFLSKDCSGLLVVIKCFLLPFLKPEDEQKINGKKLQDYLETRGFPAMNQLCHQTNMTEREITEMRNGLVTYLLKK